MFTKLIRLGQDAEVRFLPNGSPVLSFSGAYDVGHGDKKRTQWIDCAKFGDSVEKIQPYLTKGKQIVIYADDLKIDTWQKQEGGEGYKLACKVINLEFAGNSRPENGSFNQGTANANQGTTAPAVLATNAQPTGLSNATAKAAPDFNGDPNDSIPF